MDPRLNCAADICCPPPPARLTRIEILCEAGCEPEAASKIADNLTKMGVTFAPVELMDVISRLADHPNRKE
jgi:hypothetical protein